MSGLLATLLATFNLAQVFAAAIAGAFITFPMSLAVKKIIDHTKTRVFTPDLEAPFVFSGYSMAPSEGIADTHVVAVITPPESRTQSILTIGAECFVLDWTSREGQFRGNANVYCKKYPDNNRGTVKFNYWESNQIIILTVRITNLECDETVHVQACE